MHLSWKCPGLFLRTGTWPKIQAIELDDHLFVCIFCSVTCLQRVLRVSHVSYLPPGTKIITNQSNLVNLRLEDKFNSSKYIMLPECFFCNYKTYINSKTNKRSVKKRYTLQTQKMHCNASLSLLPPWSLLIPAKSTFFIFHFFIFSFFDKIRAHNF